MPFIALLLLVLIAGTGTVATPVAVDKFAGDSIYPDNHVLYMVERAGEYLESLYYNYTGGMGKAMFLLHQVKERFNETMYLLNRSDDSLANRTFKDYNRTLYKLLNFTQMLENKGHNCTPLLIAINNTVTRQCHRLNVTITRLNNTFMNYINQTRIKKHLAFMQHIKQKIDSHKTLIKKWVKTNINKPWNTKGHMP